jgi:hypothetical protein
LKGLQAWEKMQLWLSKLLWLNLQEDRLVYLFLGLHKKISHMTEKKVLMHISQVKQPYVQDLL